VARGLLARGLGLVAWERRQGTRSGQRTAGDRAKGISGSLFPSFDLQPLSSGCVCVGGTLTQSSCGFPGQGHQQQERCLSAAILHKFLCDFFFSRPDLVLLGTCDDFAPRGRRAYTPQLVSLSLQSRQPPGREQRAAGRAGGGGRGRAGLEGLPSLCTPFVCPEGMAHPTHAASLFLTSSPRPHLSSLG
jgi:hypothetical protein